MKPDWISRLISSLFKSKPSKIKTKDIPVSTQTLVKPQERITTECVGFKATDRNMVCRDYQFELGKTFTLDKNKLVIPCHSGFHFCERVENVFSYYPAHTVPRLFIVKADNAIIIQDKAITDSITFESEYDYKTGIHSDNDEFAGVCIANLILQGVAHTEFEQLDGYCSSAVMSVMGELGYVYNDDKHTYSLYDKEIKINYYCLYGLARNASFAYMILESPSIKTSILEQLLKHEHIFLKIINSNKNDKINNYIVNAFAYVTKDVLEQLTYEQLLPTKNKNTFVILRQKQINLMMNYLN